MKFGDNLRKIRKGRKISQEDLAEKVGVSRQSVSKWEVGEAYPEMNHILMLCRIFHCHINDLVHEDFSDINSLDDEIKMSVVKFKSEQQRKMKGLSKAIAIIAKVGRIITLICIPILVVTMIILGIIIHKVDVADHEIRFHDANDIISITEGNHKISIKINDSTFAEITNQNDIIKIKEVLFGNSKFAVFGYVETGFAFLVVSLFFVSIMLKSLENLFHNINRGDTPFTLENVNYIKKMAYLMIVLTILPNITGLIFEVLLKMDLDVGFEMFGLVEILFLFSIAYIFQYGYEIQLDSKGVMYGKE